MTIAIGLYCGKGSRLILAVDRQFTSPGFFKYHEKKYVNEERGLFGFTFAFAGEAGLFSEFRQKLFGFLDQADDLSIDLVRETIEGVLANMGLREPNPDPPLYMLIGLSEFFEPPRLIVFNGRAVYSVETGFHTIGCGDSSMIRYIGHHLYSPDLKENQGIALAAYLIKKATQYIDYCGEPIDVISGDAGGFKAVEKNKVEAGIGLIEAEEDNLFALLMVKPFST